MNNLIIGSSGNIGIHYLNKSKYKFNFFSSRKKNKNKKLIFLPLNLDKIKSFILEKKISSVVILTAISNPKQCKANLEYSKKINIIFIKKLVKLLIKLKIYFIFFSSEYVYPGNSKINKYTERSKIFTKMIYGKQKIQIENYLKKQLYDNYAVLRLSKTFGDNINDKTLFSKILKEYRNGNKRFKIASDQFFCPVYVNDLIKIIDIFIKKKVKGIYNVSGNTCKSRYDLIKFMSKTLNLKDMILNECSINEFDNKIYYPKVLNLSNTKLKKTINFKFTPISKILKKIK